MNLIIDFIYVQKNALIRLLKASKHIPLLMLHILVYSAVFTLLNSALKNTGLGGIVFGIILYLIRAMLFSHLLYTLYGVMKDDRFHFNHIKEGFTMYLSPSINTFFVYYLLNMVINLLMGSGTYDTRAYLLLDLLIFLASSALTETIYIGNIWGYDSIISAVSFSFENLMNWTSINTIYYFVFRSVGVNVNIFSNFPGSFSILNPIYTLAFSLVISVMLLHRGYLYSELYNSSIRKREFIRRQN